MLLAENDPGDALLVSEAFLARGFGQTLHTFSDGLEALEYLRVPTHCRPDLIIMDLNMPRIDIRKAFVVIKAGPASRSIPVVVLTISTYTRHRHGLRTWG